MTVDARGNIYIFAAYNGDSVTFDSFTIHNPYVSGSYFYTAFLLKYSPSGDVLWAVNVAPTGLYTGLFGPAIYDLQAGLAVDSSGCVYVASGYSGPSFTTAGTTLYNSDTTGATMDIFFNKYDQYGNLLWARSFGGKETDNVNVLVADKHYNIYMAGAYLSDTISFGTSYLSDSPNSFIAKFDSAGEVLSLRNLSAHSFVADMVLDSISNVYITGYIDSSTRIDTDSLISYGSKDVLVAKFDSSLNLLWASNAGCVGFDMGHSIALDTNGNIWFCGECNFPWMTDSVMHFNTHLDTFSLNSLYFIAEYSNSGNYLFSMQFGENDEYRGVAIDGSSNLYFSGDYFYTILGTDTISSTENFFVAKYQPFCPVTELTPVIKSAPNLSIYPNPASDELTITDEDKFYTSFSICDMLGQELMSQTITSATTKVSIDKLKVGLYLIHFRGDNGMDFKKLVKK
jgi:hypothetical protein